MLEKFVTSIHMDRLCIEFSSTMANVDRVIVDLLVFLKKNGEMELDVFDATLILREGLTNAVVHGNCDKYDKLIYVEVNKAFTLVKIRDEGKGFNWKKQLDAVNPEITCPSGRGLVLMDKYGFDVSYNEKGNILTLKKKRFI